MSFYDNTLKQIARILDFNADETLKQDIADNRINWDDIVKVGSEQLVIPTIYSRLKEQTLLSLLPKDLQEYLKYIYNLNEDRNMSLLNETKQLSTWFSTVGIDHVFLKGAAMIASPYYNSIGERMLGDIDVLVAKEQCEQAFDLLLEKGYTYAKAPTINPKYFEDKHLLRLAHKSHIGAVEIHFKLLDTPQEILQPQAVLKSKESTTPNNIPIPSAHYLLLHNVLNFQINDKGSYYNYFGLKNAYDSIVLLKHLNQEQVNNMISNRHVGFNFNLGHRYFKSIPKPENRFNLNAQSKVYDLKKKHSTFNSWHYKTLYYLDLFKLLLHRSWFFLINKNYRRDIIKDRTRVLEFIKSKL